MQSIVFSTASPRSVIDKIKKFVFIRSTQNTTEHQCVYVHCITPGMIISPLHGEMKGGIELPQYPWPCACFSTVSTSVDITFIPSQSKGAKLMVPLAEDS